MRNWFLVSSSRFATWCASWVVTMIGMVSLCCYDLVALMHIQLPLLQNEPVQAAFLWDPDQYQVRDAHGHQSRKHDIGTTADLCQSLCWIWFATKSPFRCLTDLFFAVVKNPLSPVEHHGGAGVNNELFESMLEQFVVRLQRFHMSDSAYFPYFYLIRQWCLHNALICRPHPVLDCLDSPTR